MLGVTGRKPTGDRLKLADATGNKTSCRRVVVSGITCHKVSEKAPRTSENHDAMFDTCNVQDEIPYVTFADHRH